jgi:hypothetical protein
MRWNGRHWSLATALLIGVTIGSAQPSVMAQDATPEAGEVMPEDVSFEPVALALGTDLEGTAELSVGRVGLEPGAAFPIEVTIPTASLFIVEAGIVTIEINGPVTVTRSASPDDESAETDASGEMGTTVEVFEAGEIAKLEARDEIYIPGGLSGEIRNEERVRAEGLAVLIAPAGSSAPAVATPAATPAP